MPGSANDALFRESFFQNLTRPMQQWFRELESKTRSDMTPLGIVGSPKLKRNIAANFSNNATVDSIDSGSMIATVRVYGPGGVGTTWHQTIGAVTGPEIPALSAATSYLTFYWVYWDGTSYHIATTALDTLPDGLTYAGTLKTVGLGGLGGTTGGGGAKYQGGGSQR